MSSVVINLPESVNMKAFDFTLYIVSKMYEDGMITAGQGAEIAGISKRTFLEVMGKYGVSVFGGSLDDLATDITNA